MVVVVVSVAARHRRAAYLPRYLPEITLMLLETLGADEPDLEELLDALEELHVVGAVVLGVRHPLAVGPRGHPSPENCKATRNCVTHVQLRFLPPPSQSRLTIADLWR